jgi:hypothetical protein
LALCRASKPGRYRPDAILLCDFIGVDEFVAQVNNTTQRSLMKKTAAMGQ